MSKGEGTRQAILERAVSDATRVGLEGLTIGGLAEALGLSKSGLFAHFQSKESLQLSAVEFAAQKFIDAAIRPSIAAPRGEPRVRAFFENWLKWPRSVDMPGGCFFVAIAAEVDDRPGPVRDRLVQLQRDWLDALAYAVRIAVGEGHFAKDIDPVQFAFEMYALMLMCHQSTRLLRDPEAEARTRRAFEDLVTRARPKAL